jgi:hypothetical protein
MTVSRGHDRLEPCIRRRVLRWGGFAMVAVLTLAQLGALVHLSAVGHIASPTTGTLVHVDIEGSATPGEKPAPNSKRETCEIIAVLQQASNIASPAPAVAVPAIEAACWPPVIIDGHRHTPWPIYKLAPSHSPPRTAA